GIEVNGGGNSQVTENTISDLEFGMRLQGTVNLEVSTNRFVECYVAITFEELANLGLEDGPPVNCRILNNQLESCGLRFSITDPAGMNHEISGNLVDGRPLAYLYGATNLQMDGREYGHIILADCEDISITGGMLDELLVMFCTNCEISGVTIANRINGVYIRYSSQIAIGYSHLIGNDIGIRVEWSSFCHVVGITAHNNGHGLLLDSSPNSTVYDCDLYDNEYGLVLIGADSSNIESNRIYRNIQGIYLLRTTDSFIGNNDVLSNNETGLLLNRGSRFNTIIANNFGWNTVNVLCSGFDNIWDDGMKKGNSWSDLGDSEIYIIDDDDFDRFPKFLWNENSTENPGSSSTGINSADIPEIVSVAVGAAAGFSLLGLIALVVRFAKRKEPI
ncbi:MAG: NosD domain-containing protein, partial [Candidatus Thorarchaeota archaeon]